MKTLQGAKNKEVDVGGVSKNGGFFSLFLPFFLGASDSEQAFYGVPLVRLQ